MRLFKIFIIIILIFFISSNTYAFTVSSGFGWRIHPITGKWTFHRGIDIPLPTGTPIVALFDGIIVWAGPRGGYGNCVIIQHQEKVYTLYAHNSKILVIPGQKIRAGELISRSGSTGMSTGPHLHLELWENNQYVNPLRIWDKTIDEKPDNNSDAKKQVSNNDNLDEI